MSYDICPRCLQTLREMENMVPRSRIDAIEKEKEAIRQKLKTVQENAREEIERLESCYNSAMELLNKIYECRYEPDKLIIYAEMVKRIPFTGVSK